MLIIIGRIVFGSALVYQLVKGATVAPGAVEAGDLTGAYYMVVCVFLAIANALLWAPYLGEKVSGPMTGMMTRSTYVEAPNWVLRALRWCDAHRYRRASVFLAFWEGIRHPSIPTAFLLGLKHARPGSWFEKVYAREVFRLNNTKNCVEAYQVLKRHGIDPRPHQAEQINAALMALERPPRPEAPVLPLPAASPLPPIRRDRRIRLFRGEQESKPLIPTTTVLAEAASEGSTLPNGGILAADSNRMEERPPSLIMQCLDRLISFVRAH